MIKSNLSLLALALGVISSQAFAGSVTGNFQTTATLSSSCIVSATNVSFGTLTPAATGRATANGTITSTCSKNISYSLKISPGNSGDALNRTMTGGTSGNTDKLKYNLYSDSSAVSLVDVWDDGTSGTPITLTGTGSSQVSTVYGALDLNQYLKPDTYTDNLTITLSY